MKINLFISLLLFTLQSFAQSPNWLSAKRAGGVDYDWASCVATDTAGNIYIAGTFHSSSITFGSTVLANSGDYDFFIAKYDSSGNVIWAKRAGGTGNDQGYSIATDGNANLIVTGFFASPSIAFGSTTLTNSITTGYADIFVAKYDASGNVLWAKKAGGYSDDMGQCVTTDPGGNIYLSGYFGSTSITFGSTVLTNAGGTCFTINCSDFFIAKYDASGNVIWAKKAGGTDMDDGRSIITHAGGNVFVTGAFCSSSITFGSTTLTNANAGYNDVFTVKYDPNGNVIWAKSAGGTYYDWGSGISTDADDNVYVTGTFQSSSIAFGSTALNTAGGKDLFLVKYNSAGNEIWATSAGGSNYDYANGITTDALGNVYITGGFFSTSITFGSTILTNTGPFAAKYDSTGNALWAVSKTAGGPYDDLGRGITTDASGKVYIAGSFNSPSITFGNTVLTNATGSITTDIFIAKLASTITTGIESQLSEDENKIIFFPNPAKNFLNVQLPMTKKGTVEIVNPFGEIIYSEKINTQQTKIDVNKFSEGIYFLKCASTDFNVTKKIIITK